MMKVERREQTILSNGIKKSTRTGLVNSGDKGVGGRRQASQKRLASTSYKPRIVLFNLHSSPLRSGSNILSVVILILQMSKLRHRKTLTRVIQLVCNRSKITHLYLTPHSRLWASSGYQRGERVEMMNAHGSSTCLSVKERGEAGTESNQGGVVLCVFWFYFYFLGWERFAPDFKPRRKTVKRNKEESQGWRGCPSPFLSSLPSSPRNHHTEVMAMTWGGEHTIWCTGDVL